MSQLKCAITALNAPIVHFTIRHQDNPGVPFSDDLLGYIPWTCSPSASAGLDGGLKLFERGESTVGIPKIVVRDVLSVLGDDVLDSVPIVLRAAN